MKEGVTASYASELRSYQASPDKVIIYAPFTKVSHRGDTLTGPLFTIEFTAPKEDVLRLRMVHFKKKSVTPTFDLSMDNQPLTLEDTQSHLDIITGNTCARIHKDSWKIEYIYKGKVVTSTGFRGLGMMDLKEGQRYMCEHLNLGVGEKIYGLGERFTSLIKNGQTIDIWNEDGGTGSEQSYKNIPFYLSNKGYGLLVNDPGKVSFEVASEQVSKIQFSVSGEVLDYLFIPGDSPKDVLKSYTSISGLPGLPPAWSFGLWLTTSFTTDYDEQTVTSFIDGMDQRNLPLHTFHFDCFWMKEYEWCNFAWDDCVFPDPEGMLKRLKAKGLHICVWINPYIGQKSPLYDEGLEKDYFIRTLDGNPWQWDLWQPGMAIVDFTNPEAVKWYESHLIRLMDMGVDSFKTDFGERIPVENVMYHDGSDPHKMHNYYAYQYNEVVYKLLQKHRSQDEAVLFARSASVGSQKFPVHWGGDCTSVYESMAESLRGGLSLCMSGFGFWSHDIGGFESTSTSDVYKRWIAFGLLSSHSRLHGSSSYRVPWLYDEESVDVLRHFTNLKCRLMPYIYSQANQTAKSGIPMMRSMFLEYPGDIMAENADMQYFLGDSLLVAPVFNAEGLADYYLPESGFTHLLSNDVKGDAGYYHESFDYLSLPLYVKPNTILPIGSNDQVPDYDYLQDIEYHVFNLDKETRIELDVYNTQREIEDTLILEKEGSSILVKRSGNKPASIILRTVQGIQDATTSYQAGSQGIVIDFPAQTTELRITL